MTERLLSFFTYFLFTLLVLPLAVALTPAISAAQSVLAPGDLMIVTVNSNDEDNFDFVPLVDLTSGTEIYFTDNAYIASGDSLDDGEGVITYTASASISAGTVVSYSGSKGNGFIESSGNYNASSSGDNLIAYQVDADTTYLYGVGWARGSTVWTYSTTSSTNRSDIPPGLSEAGHTILSLGTSDNLQYDSGSGTKGTASTLLSLVGNESSWLEDDASTYAAFSESFTLVDPPTLAFSSVSVDSSEDSGTAELTVELVEANSTDVEVKVAFLSGSSTATNGDDFSNYTTQTVSFVSGDTSGTTKTVTITLANDDTFEGNEKAVFQLQDNSTGAIIVPDVLTLTINDDDAPNIVFNEIHADPDDTDGDANGDGVADTDADEFIEFVNNESTEIDISGWTYEDDNTASYTFPEGTVIGAGNAIVLFDEGSQSPQGNFGAAYIFTDAEIGLNNSNETLTLKDASGNVVSTASYGSGVSNESFNLSPEATGSSYVAHSTLSGGSLFSPGTKVDGTTWGNGTFAIGIRVGEGWRMISSPTSGTTFNDLFASLWTQGITGSDDATGSGTQFGWTETEGGSFDDPSGMTSTMTPGKGYIVYVFEDDEFSTPGVQGGFPKTISTNNAVNSGTVSVAVTSNNAGGAAGIDGNEGFNLLGNPFGTDISVTAVLDALDTATGSNTGATDDPDFITSRNIAVWNPDLDSGNGDWEYLSDGDRLAPFQAFFMRYVADGVNESIDFIRANLAANQGTEFFKQANETKYEFKLSVEDGGRSDSYTVEFSQKGATKLDQYDAFKLFSLNADAINLYSIEGVYKLAKNALPERPEEIIEIPLSFEAPNRNELTFTWEGISELPQYWDVTLVDRTLGRELDLRRDAEYKFSFQQPVQNKTAGQNEPLYKTTSTKNSDVRFVLRVNPGLTQTVGSETLPSSVQLNPNYPNPFNPTTTISYSLTQETQVKMTVWNIVGQKVATLVDGVVEAGTHTELWNASDMPSGIYIAQMEVGGNVYIRKMTLIK